MKAALILVVWLFCLRAALAGYEAPNPAYDPPPSYYNSATGSGSTLRTNLHTIISAGFVMRSYEDAKSYLPILDQDPNNSSNIILIYNDASVAGPWVSGGVTWNREHMWPQSKLGVSVNPGSKNAGTDLFELAPCLPTINSSRSNDAYGTLTASGPYQNNSSSFFPGDNDKGDVARAMFYMATRYYDGSATPSTNNLSLVNGNAPATYQMGDLQALLKWNYTDGVDNYERRRNQYAYSSTLNPTYYQGNRNPFVDHPEYVWAVFGDSANSSQISVATPNANGASTANVNLGTILVGGILGTGNITIGKTGATPTTCDIATTGNGITAAAGVGQTFDYNSQTRSIAVGLNASTSTVGVKTGTITVHNSDLTSAGAGQGSADGNDTINISATVLAHANASFNVATDTNTKTLNFGTVYVGSGSHTLGFAVSNLISASGYIAGLDLLSNSSTGDTSILTTNLAPFGGLATGSSQAFTATFNAPVGSYSATYTLNLSDDVRLVGAVAQQLTLTLSGSVAYLRGDFNIDGQLTSADVHAMLNALTDLKAYESTNHLNNGDLLAIGDFNGDGKVANNDIQLLLDSIAGGGGASAVPEPASSILLSIGMLLVGFTRSKIR
jgi:endonuclease I